MTRIEGAAKVAPSAKGRTINTEQYWLNFYKDHDEKPSDLREKVALLNVNKKFRDVRAVLQGYLTYHSKSAESWMYEALAISIKMNQGKDSDVKTALGYAADLAVRSRNPNYLVSVADQMMMLQHFDRAGALLDQAAALVPHRGEPLVMSINLAQKLRDPRRMGDSIEKLLSLGWPGMDETLRRDARKQAELLAKTLREESRVEEADALLARLPESEARDLFIRLTWVGDAGLDLVVEEPLGATARVFTPRTVFGGSIIKDGYGSHPEEVYVCPRGFDGDYTIRVETSYNNPEKPALQALLEIITHEGTSQEHKETYTLSLAGKGPEPVRVNLKGGRRKQALPFVAPTALVPSADPGTLKKAKRAKPSSSDKPSNDLPKASKEKSTAKAK